MSREEEVIAVHSLGKQIGYGNIMDLAHESWCSELMSKYGDDGGALIVGP